MELGRGSPGVDDGGWGDTYMMFYLFLELQDYFGTFKADCLLGAPSRH